MKKFRKVIFWCHLLCGVVAGVVVLIMSVTGVLLTYQKQMTHWADTRDLTVSPAGPGAVRSVEKAVAQAREKEGKLPSTVAVRAGAEEPVELRFGREQTFYANPYTGEILGDGSAGVRKFFQVVTAWHRWLGAEGENRAVGKAVTGACNLAFLVLVVSGFYLWWPRKWNLKALRSAMLFRRGLSGKARDFSWHNVIGFWCAVPLVLIVASGVMISYPWASALVYRAVGETPPARRGEGAGRAQGGQGGERGGSLARGEERSGRGQARGEERGGRGGEQSEEHKPAVPVDGLDRLLASAESQAPGWRTISFDPAAGDKGEVAFTIEQGTAGQPQKRSKLTLHAETAAFVSSEGYADSSLGSQIRSFLRFAHTGEFFGLTGQTIAGIVSAGAVVLVWTGLALTWRRWRSWRNRRPAGAAEEAPERSETPVAV